MPPPFPVPECATLINYLKLIEVLPVLTLSHRFSQGFEAPIQS